MYGQKGVISCLFGRLYKKKNRTTLETPESHTRKERNATLERKEGPE